MFLLYNIIKDVHITKNTTHTHLKMKTELSTCVARHITDTFGAKYEPKQKGKLMFYH